MQVNNYDFTSDNCSGLKDLGYGGEFADIAYEILDVENPSETFWSDIMVTNNGKIYAVASEEEPTQQGRFYFNEIFNGVSGDGEILESLGKVVAQYNVFYKGTDSVDYSIRFIELPNGTFVVYPTNEGVAYISSEEELEDALADKDQYNDEDGYWS